MTDDNKTREIVPEDKKKNHQSGFRFVAFVLGILALGILIYYAVNNPEFPIWTLLIIMGVIIGLVVGVFKYNTLKTKYDEVINSGLDADKIPEPEELEFFERKLRDDFKDKNLPYNMIEHTKDCWPIYINRNLIYVFEVILQLPVRGIDTAFVIYNSHFPNRLPAVLYDPTDTKLDKAINRISSNPQSDPDEKIEIVENPAMGFKSEIRTKTVRDKEVSKKKKEEDES